MPTKTPTPKNPTKRRLIGLDPGLRFMGWGVVDMVGNKLVHIANGTVASDAKLSLAERLLELENGFVCGV